MSDKRQKRKYRKAVSELLYYREELRHLSSIIHQAHLDFEDYYKDFCKRSNIDLTSLQDENKERIDEMTTERQEAKVKKPLSTAEGKKLLSKIYKSIACELHPDKLITSDYSEEEKKEKEEDFKVASTAAENNDWGELLELSEDLRLDVEVSDLLLGEIEKEIAFLKKKIQSDQATFSWALYNAETVEEKDIVVKQFLKRIFNLEVT